MLAFRSALKYIAGSNVIYGVTKAKYMMWNSFGNMMGYGWGGGFGFIFTLIFWGLIFWVIFSLVRGGMGHGCCGHGSHKEHGEKTPSDILKERYAKGEISKEDFDKMRKDLE